MDNSVATYSYSISGGNNIMTTSLQNNFVSQHRSESQNIYGWPCKPGPEAEMVENFINNSLPDPNVNECRTVFIEPKIGTLKPDIVIIFWNPKISNRWPQARKNLELIDLQIMQMLHLSGPLSENELSTYFPKRILKQSINRLDQANCMVYQKDKWCLNKFQSLFVINRIIAVEAKISYASKALEQAIANSWFSSESYILMPSKQPRKNLIEAADKYGIGVMSYSMDNALLLLPAKKYGLPLSYGTWIFNEMVWRHTEREC